MSNDNKWVVTSSAHHMFVSFIVGIVDSMPFDMKPGFTAKIHYGNEINNIKYSVTIKLM